MGRTIESHRRNKTVWRHLLIDDNSTGVYVGNEYQKDNVENIVVTFKYTSVT